MTQSLYIGAEPGEEVRPCGRQPAHLWGGPGRMFRPAGRQRGGQNDHLQDADGGHGRHGGGSIRQRLQHSQVQINLMPLSLENGFICGYLKIGNISVLVFGFLFLLLQTFMRAGCTFMALSPF
jgi:hypothetical protein